MISPPPTHTLFPYTTLFRSFTHIHTHTHTHTHTPELGFGLVLPPKKRIHSQYAGRGGLFPLPPLDDQENLADRKSTRLNSSHTVISYAVFCLKKKKKKYG